MLFRHAPAAPAPPSARHCAFDSPSPSTPVGAELNDATFDKEVFASGKSAFVKFLAPW